MSDICKHNVFVGEHSNGCPRCKEETIARLKQELNAAQADARALAEVLNRFDGADTDELPFIADDAMFVLQMHGARYLKAQP